MRIQHNIPAMNAYRNYSNNTSALSKNLEKLSSGYKINRAGDDAAGLAISEKMRAQITGLSAAQKNVKDGISLVKTAEGAMQEIHDMLNRMDYLATQSANGTYDNEVDRLNLQKEVDSLKEEINRIADSANFNGIKLLDGSLGAKTSGAMETGKLDAVDMMDGITINAPEDGAGAKQTYELKFSDPEALFGAGDSIEFKLTNTENNKVETFKVSYDTTAATGKFTGATTAEQLQSIADAINGASSNTGDSVAFNTTGYKAEVNATGDGIVFTNDKVGAPKYTMDPANVVVTDAQSTLTTAETNKGGMNKTGASQTDMALELLGATSTGASTPIQIDDGDTLQFNFNVNGQNMKVTLEAGKDFQISSTKDISETTTNIVNALKNAKFDDNAATKAVDESLLKVDDYFNFTANKNKDGTAANGQIQVEADGTNAGATKLAVGIGNVDLFKGTSKDAIIANDAAGSANTPSATVKKTATGTVTAAVGADIHDISATPSANYSEGEKIKLTGKLKDGRDFEIELTATSKATPGKNEFKIGTAATDSVDNITSALLGNDAKLTVKNADGTTIEIDAKEVFTNDGANGTLKVENNGGALKVSTPTNSVVKGISAEITFIESTNKAPVVGKLEETAAGADQASSVNKLTFDPAEVEQGTTLTIDGKTYEFVDASGLDADSGKNAFITKDGNVAVAVTGLNDKNATGEDLANALKAAMGGDEYTSADGAKYDITVDGNSMTIKSQVVGETAKALSVEQGESKPTSSLTFNSTPAGTVADPAKVNLDVKAGDTVTINGKTYEFIEAGKRTSAQENVGIELTDSINTPEAAAKALADAVNANDGEAVVARADGGSVIFTSKYKTDAEKDEIAYTYAAPEIDLPKTSKGLTLQIGDTADKFNQMSVEIGDMHTKAMGKGKTTLDGKEVDVTKTIADIDISTQDGAQEAIAVIKNAINYVSGVRGDLGAVQNRLDHTANNLSVMQENIQDAESTIRDTDVAEEMMSYVKNNILVQSAQAMLAQANQLPQGVLQLLG